METVIRRQTLADLLHRSAKRFPHKTAIECGATRWSFAEFDGVTERLAADGGVHGVSWFGLPYGAPPDCRPPPGAFPKAAPPKEKAAARAASSPRSAVAQEPITWYALPGPSRCRTCSAREPNIFPARLGPSSPNRMRSQPNSRAACAMVSALRPINTVLV